MQSARDETTKKLDGEELNDAIKNVLWDGNVSGLRELLETYDHVTERDIDFEGGRALHFAAWSGHVDVVKLLIKYGAEVNAVDNKGSSVLFYASYYSKSVPLTLELLCLGAKIDKNALKDDKTGLLLQIEKRFGKIEKR